MPRTPAPIPPITPIPRELSVEDVRDIITTAERAQARRSELTAEMKAALEANDVPRLKDAVRRICGLEEIEQ